MDIGRAGGFWLIRTFSSYDDGCRCERFQFKGSSATANGICFAIGFLVKCVADRLYFPSWFHSSIQFSDVAKTHTSLICRMEDSPSSEYKRHKA